MLARDAVVQHSESYGRFARPAVARLLRVFGLDVEFVEAAGDYLFRAGDIGGRPVLDLVGGYGASLFGHHHPELVRAMREGLTAQIPVNAQASIRPRTARLAERLSGLVGAETGGTYVVTFGSTGSDAVEAAMKHAAVQRHKYLDSLFAELSTALRRVVRDGLSETVVTADRRTAALGVLLAESIDSVAMMRRREPCFVSLGGAFHGKTTGAATLTESVAAADGLRLVGPTRVSLSNCVDDEQATMLDEHLLTIVTVRFDPAGAPVLGTTGISTLAACFVEPIQGEGGVREVSTQTLQTLRGLTDRHNAALVFDEIQCGMGRTGMFLCSSASGVTADYYLLAKSLGGGLVKISALLVNRENYVEEFGLHHTSTFADDDLSAVVALAAVDLAATLPRTIRDLGFELDRRLQRIVERWPQVYAAVRGRGLLMGIELRPVGTESVFLRQVFDPDRLGYLVSGYLLNRHDIRVLPTLSAPTTLRLEPSAFLDHAGLDRVEAAFDDVARRIDRRDFADLLGHLAAPPASELPLPRTVTAVAARRGSTDRDVPLVAFLANLEGPDTVRRLAPELAGWTDAQCAAVLDRTLGEIEPFEVIRGRIRSAMGGELEVMTLAVPFSAEQAVRLVRSGERSWLSRKVSDAVEYAATQGASVIGLGGYTSIITDAARDIVEDQLIVTTGNSLAAACAYRSMRHRAEAGGLECVGVVGALGNIGAVLADLIAAHANSVLLVGTPGSVRRLNRLAETLMRRGHRVRVADDLSALRECDVVVSASNSPAPLIHPALLDTEAEVLVYDLAVPGDVDPAVSLLPNVGWYTGGQLRLPLDQDFTVPGAGLRPGVVHACLAEAVLVGFEPGLGGISYGGLNPAGVHAVWDAAMRHGCEAVEVLQTRSGA